MSEKVLGFRWEAEVDKLLGIHSKLAWHTKRLYLLKKGRFGRRLKTLNQRLGELCEELEDSKKQAGEKKK